MSKELGFSACKGNTHTIMRIYKLVGMLFLSTSSHAQGHRLTRVNLPDEDARLDHTAVRRRWPTHIYMGTHKESDAGQQYYSQITIILSHEGPPSLIPFKGAGEVTGRSGEGYSRSL